MYLENRMSNRGFMKRVKKLIFISFAQLQILNTDECRIKKALSKSYTNTFTNTTRVVYVKTKQVSTRRLCIKNAIFTWIIQIIFTFDHSPKFQLIVTYAGWALWGAHGCSWHGAEDDGFGSAHISSSENPFLGPPNGWHTTFLSFTPPPHASEHCNQTRREYTR